MKTNIVRGFTDHSPDAKEVIVSLFCSGILQAEISGRLGIPRTTITSLLTGIRNIVLRTNREVVHLQSRLNLTQEVFYYSIEKIAIV